MTEETRYNLEEIGTAAHLMIEAVDKASQDLESTVRSSTEQLQAFNNTLAKNFVAQLTKLAESSVRVSDKGVEELEARKEDFVERLLELEQTELETLVRVGKEIRQELDQSLRNSLEKVSQLVEQQLDALRPIAMDQHENFSSLITKEGETLKTLAKEGTINIVNKKTFSVKQLSERAEEFENAANSILEETKHKLWESMKNSKDLLSEEIVQVKDTLTRYVNESKQELEQQVKTGNPALLAAGKSTTKRLGDEVDDWHAEILLMANNFKEALSKDSNSFDQIHKTKIERQVEEIKEEIKTIGSEAQGRLSASHKLFQGSLRRLEKKYNERLDKLLQQFEAAITQEAKILGNIMRPNLPSQASNELKELLNTRLKARGLEIIKAFKRQVELFDLEHARFSASCSERIEMVNSAAKDSLEQQLKSLNAEIERMLRSFKVELSQLKLQLPQVKDAGHAAALAVVAYKRARLDW